MTYTLELDLKGADKVLSTVNALNSIKSGGGMTMAFGGTSGISKQTEDISRLVRQVQRGTVGVHALGKELKNLGQSVGVSMSASQLKNLSPAVLALNPQLAALAAASSFPGAGLNWKQYGLAHLARLNKFALPNVNLPQFRYYTGPKPPVLSQSQNLLSQISQIPMLGRFFTIVGAITAGLEILRKGIRMVSDSINRGFGLYSGAGQSGLSTSFYAQRTALSSIFGISGNPNQVFMFGKAVTDVSNRIRGATNILAANAPQLSQIHINFDVLKLDFAAMASQLATQLAPAINLFMAALDTMVKNIKGYAQTFIALSPALKFLGQVGTAWALTPAMQLASAQNVKAFTQPLSQLHPLMRQLPASSLEKMGLLIGGGLGNPVVNQLRISNQHLKKIADAIAPRGVPRGNQFNLAGNVNNP